MPEYNQNRPRQGAGYQGGNRGNDRREDIAFDFNPWNQKIKTWISSEIDKDTIVFADGFGKNLKDNGLTTSQIRIAFGELRKIQMNGFWKEKPSFLLLKAKLAYATQRHKDKGKGVEEFYKLFSLAYDHINTNDETSGSKQFGNLMQLIEAVLAYHKFHGGKE